MPRPPCRPSNPQLELFGDSASSLEKRAPSWTTLPEQTRRVLTVLVTRMLIAHVGDVTLEREGCGNDV